MKNKINYSSVGRRRFLQAVGGFSLSTGSALATDPEKPSGNIEYDPQTEVPRVHAFKHTKHDQFIQNTGNRAREVVINTIPRQQWKVVEAADRALELVQRELSDLTPTPEAVVTIPAGRGVMDPRGIVIRHVTQVLKRGGQDVVVTEPDYSLQELTDIVKDRFPDRLTVKPTTTLHPASPYNTVPRPGAVSAVEGIPVKVEEIQVAKNSHDGDAQYYNRQYRPVPAGCWIDTDLGVGDGTLGTPVKGIFGNDLCVTAGHLLKLGEDYADEINQPSAERLGGTDPTLVKLKTNSFDAGVVNRLDLDVTWQIAEEGSSGTRGSLVIRGSRTRNWLKDGQGKDISLKKQGITHALAEGEILDWGTHHFESNHTQGSGDSGGPYWHTVDFDETYICGIHEGPVGLESLDPTSRATFMESIENQFFVAV